MIHAGFAKQAGAISKAVKAHGLTSRPAGEAIDAFARRSVARGRARGEPAVAKPGAMRLAKGMRRGRALVKQALEVESKPYIGYAVDDSYTGAQGSSPTRVLGQMAKEIARSQGKDSPGRRRLRSAVQGAKEGGKLGLGIGAMLGFLRGRAGGNALKGTVVGGVNGALLGGALGAADGTWRTGVDTMS